MILSSKPLSFAVKATMALIAITTSRTSLVVEAAPHDFDDLPPGSVYVVGDHDISQGVDFFADCFYWFGVAAPFCGGFSMVVPPPTPTHPDCPEMGENTMMLNNINLIFAYSESSIKYVREPWYPFVYYGGNVNFNVDGGALHNFNDILDANGVAMGNGCVVSFEKLVTWGSNNSCGYFVLNNCKVEKFMVGGQETFWDGAN